MFTGIVKEIGRITRLSQSGGSAKIGVKSSLIYAEAQASDSIAVAGVCLTLIYKERGVLFFEAAGPTLAKTTLKRMQRGDYVNLEPALKLGSKLGGHFVLGHVDSEVRLRRVRRLTGHHRLEVELPRAWRKFVVENGSLALEGVSLTVKQVLPQSCSLDIIPFTYEQTTLKYRRPGDWLNLECDYLLKGKQVREVA